MGIIIIIIIIVVVVIVIVVIKREKMVKNGLWTSFGSNDAPTICVMTLIPIPSIESTNRQTRC